MYEELIKSLRKEAEDTYHFLPKILYLQAANAIEELQKPKWIPVSERLPETDKCVLVISYGRVCYARLLGSGNNARLKLDFGKEETND